MASPVFHDASGRRWTVLRALAYALAVLASVLLTAAVVGIVANPALPRFRLPQTPGLPRNTSVRPPPLPKRIAEPPPAVRKVVEELARAQKRTPLRRGRRPQLMKVAPPPAAPPPPLAVDAGAPATRHAPIAAGFYVNWDDSSYASLRRNLAQLDWVIPEWARLAPLPADAPLKVFIDPRALDLVRRERPSTRILPLVQNFHDGAWDGPLAAARLHGAPARAALVAALTALVADNAFSGVVLDLEEIDPAAQPDLLLFLGELHAAFAARGWLVGEAVPFDDEDWDYAAHAARTDTLFLMAYDEHWAASAPGPVAGEPWYAERLAARLRTLDPARVIVCIGGYGYDWTVGDGGPADVVSFQEAVRDARDNEVPVTFDAASRSPVVRFDDEDGRKHEVWFLDAVTAYDEMRIAARAGVGGFALWRLGVEDPSLWGYFRGAGPAAPPPPTEEIRFPYDVDFEDTGELLQVVAEPNPGRRAVTVDARSGLVTGARYLELPSSYAIRRTGDRPGLVALTFDDGPDPTYTPAILDVLRREGVHATFFLIGENGQRHPELVRRIVGEGHDLGNHTYTHPNLGEASPERTDLELQATQRLVEALTGRAMRLFRPPYFGDAEPQTPDEVAPIVRAQKLGYVTVGLRIDPADWALPGADAIVARTLAGAGAEDDEAHGHVVLLHDGGGDRSATVAALPRLIAGLRAKGLRIVPVSELAAMTRDQAMPPVTGASGRVTAVTDSIVIYALAVAGWVVRWLFVVGLFLGIGRIAVVIALALVGRVVARRREAALAGAAPSLRFTVLVPAYNEEKVIARTIESLLAQRGVDFEIVVIDDGSKDRTSEVVREQFGGDSRVRAFRKENGGKAEALNFGLERAQGDIVVALDADTVFPPDTLAELVRPFADPRVGAVAGNAKVGNRINLVTRWQALEYIASQNLDRRAYALLDCITVVPGAVGAWRRDVLAELGGFASDTLAEDQDLTLKVRRRGYRVAYAERAVAYTEAPDTLGTLSKQRFRWSFGTLQCMWKHRDALFRPRYGALAFFAMPSVWIFQIAFPLFAPLVDALLFASLASAAIGHFTQREISTLGHLEPVMFYYALFLIVDWLGAAAAFLFEPREEKSLLGWFLLQRVAYRQVMYSVMVRSVLAALRGGLVGWGKLDRKATVTGGAPPG